jgi:hypothetical protein
MGAPGTIQTERLLRLLVTADDRSGAMEAAARCADAGLRPVVTSWDGDPPVDGTFDCEVVDLRSRHVSGDEAAARARTTLGRGAAHRVHKMDSTLRGNWIDELGALQGADRLLVVPAYPSAGRTCEGGLVRVHGVPVGQTEFGRDQRSVVATSRPAELLDAAELSGPDSLAAWLDSGTVRAGVADACTDAEVAELVALAAERRELLIAGTALVVGEVARSLVRGVAGADATHRSRISLPPGPVLVVCGSRHPTSVRQAESVVGLPGVTVFLAPAEEQPDPEVVALGLAVRAHDHLAATGTSIVVLLGGDTADAFLGERVGRVLGSLDTGMALGETAVDGRTITIVTKPGGFGHDRTVYDLLSTRNDR